MLPELYQVVFHCSGKTAKTGRAGSKGHGSPRLETGPQLIPTAALSQSGMGSRVVVLYLRPGSWLSTLAFGAVSLRLGFGL